MKDAEITIHVAITDWAKAPNIDQHVLQSKFYGYERYSPYYYEYEIRSSMVIMSWLFDA